MTALLQVVGLVARSESWHLTIEAAGFLGPLAVDQSQRTLNHERNTRRDTVAELQGLRSQIKSSLAADRQRYRGLHQWNIDVRGHELWIWGDRVALNVTRQLAGSISAQEVRLHGSEVVAVLQP